MEASTYFSGKHGSHHEPTANSLIPENHQQNQDQIDCQNYSQNHIPKTLMKFSNLCQFTSEIIVPNPKEDKDFLRDDIWSQNAEIFIDLKITSGSNLLELAFRQPWKGFVQDHGTVLGRIKESAEPTKSQIMELSVQDSIVETAGNDQGNQVHS